MKINFSKATYFNYCKSDSGFVYRIHDRNQYIFKIFDIHVLDLIVYVSYVRANGSYHHKS